MPLYPSEHTKILPAAQAEWDDEQCILALQVHFRNQIPQLVTEIESVYESLNGKKVLDLSCGGGRLLEAFPKMSFYLGIDQSELIIEQAKKRFPQHHFLCAKIEDYRNPNRFDIVTYIDALQCSETPLNERLRGILVLFDADVFLFRTCLSRLYSIGYFADLVTTIDKCTDCTARLAVTNVQGIGVYIVCKRKPIRRPA